MGDHLRTRTTAAALAVAALLTLTACDSGDDPSPRTPESSAQDTGSSATGDVDTAATDTSAPAAEDEAESATLPDLVGLDLQAAQDEAQAAGFYVLDDQDASGQGRLQIYDRNWTVCSQDPEVGAYPTDTPVTLYAVKDDESC